MFSELDETIRQVLIKEGRLDSSEVDVSFEIPNRAWSQGISKPTINCYLFDIRENHQLRHTGVTMERQNGTGAARRRQPMVVALTYLITAWTRAVEDEHRLLFHALSTLMRFGVLPEQHLQGALREHELPIHTQIVQPDGVLKSPGEFWTALENHLKPALNYSVNLCLDYARVAVGPPVLSTGITLHTTGGELAGRLLHFGGTVRDRSAAPIGGAEVWVDGHRGPTFTDLDGHYRLQVPVPGRYTVVVRVGAMTERREVDLPAAGVDLVLAANDRAGRGSAT
jgi:hypothetical protein